VQLLWTAVAVAALGAEPEHSRFEFVLYPATAQLNGKYSQHHGTAASVLWHPTPGFALQVSGHYHWYNRESAFTDELFGRAGGQVQAATTLLSTWGVVAGFELAPMDGTLLIGDRESFHLSLLVNGGIGIGGTRLQLIGDTAQGPARFGDTGPRFITALGAGLKVGLGRWFAVRLELRDVFFSGRIDQINGCAVGQLNEIEPSFSPLDNSRFAVAACDDGPFSDPFHGVRDLGLARYRLQGPPSSDIVHVVGLYLGLSLLIP
jgi:hypothetical protein